MSKDIFVSYSRHDQEFVIRLAEDLNAHVAGVWFDQSTIQAGQNWHDEILEGIRECKAFVLVLSPDAVESRYVREELDKALELGKPIFPVIYRAARWTDEFAALIKDIQTIDLRSGSYIDNFHKLVDGLVDAGAIKTATYERPFLREPTEISLNVVFRKAVKLGIRLEFWLATLLVNDFHFSFHLHCHSKQSGLGRYSQFLNFQSERHDRRICRGICRRLMEYVCFASLCAQYFLETYSTHDPHLGSQWSDWDDHLRHYHRCHARDWNNQCAK